MSDATAGLAQRLVQAAATTIATHAAELNALDSLVGDGDHGVNFATALTGAAAELHAPTAPTGSASAIFLAVEETLAGEMGGAAGVIFGAFFGGFGRGLAAQPSLDATAYAAALEQALADVQQWGKAAPGDKTLVDALAPAAQAANHAAGRGANLTATAYLAAEGARTGAEATMQMEARKGRARFVGARAVGHADAGATSLALILQAWAELLEREAIP
jgi:dihydroxyacetone kinase-like protein